MVFIKALQIFALCVYVWLLGIVQGYIRRKSAFGGRGWRMQVSMLCYVPQCLRILRTQVRRKALFRINNETESFGS
jgi:hypothetical protein